jgi:hypothetical protein
LYFILLVKILEEFMLFVVLTFQVETIHGFC